MDPNEKYEQWQGLVYSVYYSILPWIQEQNFPSLRSVDHDDILQSGRIGLLNALRKSAESATPHNTVEMFVFAKTAIFNAMIDEANKLASLVRLPRWRDLGGPSNRRSYQDAMSCRVIADFLHLDRVKVYNEDDSYADAVFAQILFVDPAALPDDIVAERDWLHHVTTRLKSVLTHSEWTILHMLSIGRRRRDIASAMGITENDILCTMQRVRLIAKSLLETD